MSREHCGKWPPDPRCLARNVSSSAARIAIASIKGNKVRVPEEVREARLSICRSNKCGKFYENRGTMRCKQCGCFMGGIAGKLQWATEQCPLGYWKPYNP